VHLEVPVLGLEIQRPNRQTVVGFIVTWVCVIVLMLLTLVVTRIGA